MSHIILFNPSFNPNPNPNPNPMARIITRSLPFSTRSPTISTSLRWFSSSATSRHALHGHSSSAMQHPAFPFPFPMPTRSTGGIWRGFQVSPCCASKLPFAGHSVTSVRGLRQQLRRRNGVAKKRPPPPKEKEIELCVWIGLHDDLPKDLEVLNVAEMLKLNGPMAMKIAFDGLKDIKYETRDDKSISDVGKYEKAELSLVFCNDESIRKINGELIGEDRATDMVSVSHHVANLDFPILALGKVMISVESAARKAEERGHTLLDEVRILFVRGLLRLLGFAHEYSDEAKNEMEKEEQLVLKSLGWRVPMTTKNVSSIQDEQVLEDGIKKAKSLRFYRPKFRYIFCDMDGTLMNSKSQISKTTAEALKEAVSRGVKIVIATGKTRPAVIDALSNVGLAGKGGVVSNYSPGVFIQGLLVYGMQGQEIYRRNLDLGVCREAFSYSMKHSIPLIAFCRDRCLTLFEHPSVDCLHTIYHEPKAEIIPSIDDLLSTAEIQKLIFLDTAEGVSSTLRPFWEESTNGRAGVVQAVPDMLEIVPPKTSKGKGVKLLLDHLNVSSNEVMAIGDGENDVEMLELASLGVALANGSDKAKSVANVIGFTNDEDGAAKAIYDYAF